MIVLSYRHEQHLTESTIMPTLDWHDMARYADNVTLTFLDDTETWYLVTYSIAAGNQVIECETYTAGLAAFTRATNGGRGILWTRGRDDNGRTVYTGIDSHGHAYRIDTDGVPSWKFTLTYPNGEQFISRTLADAKGEAESYA